MTDEANPSATAEPSVVASIEDKAAVLIAEAADRRSAQSAPVALQRRAMDMAPASLDAEARTVDAVLSAGSPVSRRDWEGGDYTEILDMDPRCIRMERMNRGAPILDSHDYWGGTRAVVGAVVPGSARSEGSELRAKIKFSRSPEGERVMQDVRDGVLRHLSVGYLTHGYEVDKTTSPPTRRATDWEPHEASVVAIPADPKAGFRALTPAPRKDPPPMEPDTCAAPVVLTELRTAEPALDQRAIDTEVASGVAAELGRHESLKKMARKLGLPESLALDHIQAGTTVDAFRDVVIDAKAADDATRAAQSPVGDGWEGRDQIRGFPTILPNSALKTPEPGQRAAQIALSLAVARGVRSEAAKVCESRFGGSSISTRALNASIGSAGGFLIPQELSAELIDYYRPRTVVRRACPASRQISLPRGNLTIGRQNSGALVGYIGEGQSTAYTQESFGEINLVARKAKALVPISNDLIRFAQSGADMKVRDDLAAQLAVLEDQNFLRGPGSVNTPKGLRYLASSANILTATASYNISTVISDMTSCVNTLQTAYVPMTNPAWFFNQKSMNYLYDARDSVGGFLFREEMMSGKFRGYPYYWTQSIPVNLGSGANQSEIYFVDMDEFIIGDVPGLMIDASPYVSYSSDGSTLTNSAFDRDETVIRIIAEHDCNIKHTGGAAILTAVPWGN